MKLLPLLQRPQTGDAMHYVWWNVSCLLASLCLSCAQAVQNSTTGTTAGPDWTPVTNSTATHTSGQTEATSQLVTSSTPAIAINSTTPTAITTPPGPKSVWHTIGSFFTRHWYAGLAGGIIIIIIIIIVVVCIVRRCRRRPPSAEKEKTRLRPWNLSRFSIIRNPIRESTIFSTDFDIIPSTRKPELPPVSPKGDSLPKNGACDVSQQLYAVPMRRVSAPTSPSPRSSCLRLYYQSSPLGPAAALAAALPAPAAAAALYDLPPPPPSPPTPLVPAKVRPPSVTYKIPSNIPAIPKQGLPSVRSALDLQPTCPSGPSDVPQLPKGGSREQRGRSLLSS